MGPYKCPDCGVWWAGLEHRCRAAETSTGVRWDWDIKRVDGGQTVTYTVRCTCPLNRGDNFLGTCPLHDVTITYRS